MGSRCIRVDVRRLLALRWLVPLLAIQLAGCSVELTREHRLYCRMDETLGIRETLYFGRSIPNGGLVGDADWKRFESETIARAFPNGFTVIDAHGSWRGAEGAMVSEPSIVVAIVHPDDAESESAIREIIRRYRDEFHQESVLRDRTAACTSL
ncbi:MAG TPA: DUF3574 domain-containing protein [Rhodanobacteraceae bacterium]|jgi:hypothetical protein|nr:DUF3574 domain-containing protein [Rhodanobacteraceae bacterium]